MLRVCYYVSASNRNVFHLFLMFVSNTSVDHTHHGFHGELICSHFVCILLCHNEHARFFRPVS